jgi:hypothetical protein
MALGKPDHRPIYTIDAQDRLVEVNSDFAGALPYRSAPQLSADVKGRPIWDFIGGAVPRQLWQVLYSRVRGAGAAVFVPLRADTASRRRLIDLELYPRGERCIRHVCECVWTEERAAVALLDENYPRDDRQLIRCAWCARFQLSRGEWCEVEEAHTRLALGTPETLPTVQDGVCTPCKQSILKNFPLRVA